MKDMEREKFEESLKSAFDKAEINPSANVWTNIELDLEKAKGGHLRRRLFFYQMLAAASVVFGMTIAGVGYYYSFHRHPANSTLLAQQHGASATPQRHAEAARATNPDAGGKNAETDVIKQPFDADKRTANASEVAGVQSRDESEAVGRQIPSPSRSDETSPTFASRDKNISADGINPGVASLTETDNDTYPPLPLRVEEMELSSLHTPRPVRLDLNKKQPEVDPVQQMLANLERREREVQVEEKNNRKTADNESLWTSIGFAAGSFNTMQASAPSSPSRMDASTMALAAPIVDQESKASGYSYSMGVNVGTRISERWVFQGGVNYLTHSAEFTANNVVMDGLGRSHAQQYKPATTNAVVKAEGNDLSNKIVYTAPYSVNNNMRYLSIPMQAGYLVVDKTVGVQLNAGVSTDLFLQNTVSGQSDQLAKTSQGSGADSPYRTFNLSGLFGTEVSYRFGPHYRVSLNPGIRYPFSTIYKSELGVQSSPLTFDVGLRFRYIFH